MSSDVSVPKDKLFQNFRTVVADAEELLRATASQAGEKVAAARERIQDSLHTAKVKLAEAEDVIVQRSKQAARVTDDYVHENPWQAVGAAAGVGLVVGLLIGRR
ncbi:MAG: YqjD family protein [Burkholderiales bacterium]